MRTLRVIRKALATTGFMMIFWMCAMAVEDPMYVLRWLGVAILFLWLGSAFNFEKSTRKRTYEAPQIIEKGEDD